MASGKRASIGVYMFLLVVSIFNILCPVSTQPVILSRISPYEIEGEETEFKCTFPKDYFDNAQNLLWRINGTSLMNGHESRGQFESRLKKKLYRNQTGSTLMCISQPAEKTASLTLNVMYPPSAMTLQVNTTHLCESDTECSADVTIGSRYRFTCNASGSNPASNITWLINTNACSGMGHKEMPPDWSQARQDETNEDWETSSQIQLQILPKHRQGSIACRATFPDGGTVFREIVMKLDSPSAVTLQVNTTHLCESETQCSADVKIGSRYRFICNASGSNPASNITWPIKTKTEILSDGTQLRQEEANGDWETSSEIHLQIRPEHRLGSIICRVMCPVGGTVFREIVMVLSVNDKLDILQLLAIIIPAAGTVLAVVVIVTVCTLRSNAKPQRAKEVTEVMEEGTTKKCNFPRSKITLFGVIGSGNFGQVFRATADGILQEGVETEVAVKVLKESADKAAACDFKKEIAIHKTLKRHPNVVSMFGCCTDSEPFVIILELLPGGSLQGYLRNKKQVWTEEAVEGAEPVPPSQLLAFASQIANGLEYLSSVGCIHRDLAVRNILLDKDMVCKLSDFGLARDVSETQQYEMTSMGMIPVRWLAIESLLDDVYTTMSDVWSFGVLLWEIVTLGAHPYRGMHARDVIDSIERGFRLPNPAHCSEQLYEVMNETWQETPSERPTFRELRETLEGMIPEAPIYLDMANFVTDQYVGENS